MLFKEKPVILKCGLKARVLLCCRGLKDLEQDSSSMEKRFAYKFLKKLLKYVDSAQEFIAHLGMLLHNVQPPET